MNIDPTQWISGETIKIGVIGSLGALLRWLQPPRPKFVDGLAKFLSGTITALVFTNPVRGFLAPFLVNMDVSSQTIIVCFTLGFMGERAIKPLMDFIGNRLKGGANSLGNPPKGGDDAGKPGA